MTILQAWFGCCVSASYFSDWLGRIIAYGASGSDALLGVPTIGDVSIQIAHHAFLPHEDCAVVAITSSSSAHRRICEGDHYHFS